jgi:hypothetical protein
MLMRSIVRFETSFVHFDLLGLFDSVLPTTRSINGSGLSKGHVDHSLQVLIILPHPKTILESGVRRLQIAISALRMPMRLAAIAKLLGIGDAS